MDCWSQEVDILFIIEGVIDEPDFWNSNSKRSERLKRSWSRGTFQSGEPVSEWSRYCFTIIELIKEGGFTVNRKNSSKLELQNPRVSNQRFPSISIRWIGKRIFAFITTTYTPTILETSLGTDPWERISRSFFRYEEKTAK